MFDCRACAAKDQIIAALKDENSRLWQAHREDGDRFQALTGTLSEVANNRVVEDEPEPPEVGENKDAPETDDATWAESELERRRIEVITKGGRVRPDFPI